MRSNRTKDILILTFLYLGIIALLVAIVVPNFIPARKSGSMPSEYTCRSNLRQIDGAKEQWAFDNGKPPGGAPSKSDLYGGFLYLKNEPRCPDGGIYTIGAVSKKPTCSLSAKHSGHAL